MSKKIISALSAWSLFISSVIGLLLVVSRITASIFEYWKFGKNFVGIDIGAYSSLYFLGFCLIGIFISFTLLFSTWNIKKYQINKISLAASLIFFIDALAVLILVLSKGAFLYCGR